MIAFQNKKRVNESLSGSTRSLDTATVGSSDCIGIQVDGDDAVRLKRLGICEGRVIEVIATGDPMIVQVGGSKIGLSRRLATSVFVRNS